MTDITELAQSMKRRATSAKEFGESLYVKADDVLALVEALEEAQAENTDGVDGMAESYETTISMMRSRIAELESRTVKLPQRYDLIGETDGNCSLNDAEMAPDNDGVYLRVRDVREMLTAAGIKWEAE